MLSSLVTEEQPDGDLKIYFAGLTGRLFGQGRPRAGRIGHAWTRIREIPLVFQCWEKWLRDAGICDSLKRRRLHRDPRVWLPAQIAQPAGRSRSAMRRSIDRLRKAYAEAYQAFFRDYLPDNGVPARFTVHLMDVPDKAASYEFYSVRRCTRRRCRKYR